MTDPVAPAAPASQDTPPADPAAPATPVAADPSAPPAATPPADPPAPQGPWGDDWRQKIAGQDEKALTRLSRYSDPKALADALFEAQKKISSGEFKKPLAADATPEQVAAWRQENGVPDKPEGYFEKLPQGVVLGEEDRALFGEFATRMHAKNVTPEVMHEIVSWYNEFKDQQATAFSERENASLEQTNESLRSEWGAEFKVNLHAIKSLLSKAPEGISDRLQSARMADGTPLLNDPATMRWLAQTAREINPIATIVPNASNPTMGIEAEIKSIETRMRTDRKGYMADSAQQARYRDLVNARERLAKAG